MESKAIFIFASIFLALAVVKAQTVNVNCNFAVVNSIYTCQLSGVTIDDDENQNIVIGGQHLPGLSNTLVFRVEIGASSIPFIIPQLFTTFPNLATLGISDGGILRIQTNAFANAGNLRSLNVIDNADLQEIQANAFAGAPRLVMLEILMCQLRTIHATAFNGLSELQSLNLEGNQIQQIPVDVFRPLTALNIIDLSSNSLEVIDGRLFNANTNLVAIVFYRNSISAIGKSILDNLPNIRSFNMVGNICANATWTIGVAGTTIETVREGLNSCFDNSIEPPPEEDVKRYIIELRGSLVVRNENGTVVGRLQMTHVNYYLI